MDRVISRSRTHSGVNTGDPEKVVIFRCEAHPLVDGEELERRRVPFGHDVDSNIAATPHST